MLNDSQLNTARLHIERITRLLEQGQGPIDPHRYDDHLRTVRTLERQIGGTRKHLANMAHPHYRGPRPVGKSHLAVSHTHIGRLEKALGGYLAALVVRMPDRPKTWIGVQAGGPSDIKGIGDEVMTGKGVINVVQKTMKLFEQGDFSAQVRHDFQMGQSYFNQAQPQQLDAVTGLLMMVAAVLEAMRMRGFLKRPG